jgi:hypothetical protein
MFKPIVLVPDPFPVTPEVETATVQVVDGGPPEAVTDEILGVPLIPEPFTTLKSPAATLLTASENVTVHDRLDEFVGVVPAMFTELNVGAMVL